MNRILLVIMALFFLNVSSQGQKYFTKSAGISFFSKAKVEDIEAVNKTAACVLDSKTGQIQLSVLIKAFEFQKALMQEHFNENYMESSKYPRAEFKGYIINNSEIDYSKPGTYQAKVKGQLTIHGITREIEAEGTIIKNDKLEISSNFIVQLSDYKISIPSIVKDNISSNVKVTIAARLDSFSTN